MIRNKPGHGVREWTRGLLAWGSFLCGVGVGLFTGVVLYWAMASAGWAAWPAATVGAVVLILTLVAWKSKFGTWTLKSAGKGIAGETVVGGAIQDALMRPDCAVWHSIPGKGDRGEIDHLVVTPVGVWVIETKYQWVPRKKYRAVMQRLALNVDSVRRTLGRGATVRGCLVLATVHRRKRSSYRARGETLSVFSVRSFREQLRDEARTKGWGSELAVQAMRKLAA